ncbi:MAG: tRNA (guanosine(46)-N7)-methyltransferase TrmB [Candidatus Cloacimonetes bacterium]|nr:tRNA (guanosine(46)-N7)-methyltransferase TrmB [Candidatus Cloacimonadota bacterium]
MRKVNIPPDYEAKKAFFLIHPESRLDYKTLFHNDNPVHLEIGCGKGEFISTMPVLHPEINFLGIEMKLKRIIIILKRLWIDTHPNVRLLQLYVDEKVTEVIPEGSLDKIYIQHPDPWPKRRHNKNRLIQQPFLDALHKMLKVGATVELSTDHPDYAEWIVEEFAKRRDFEPIFPDGYTQESPYREEHITTFFEKVNAEAGFKPYFMHYKKL